MIKHKRKFALWLTLTIIFMGVIFYQSSMPYPHQDIKPWLVKDIKLTPQNMPHVEFNYDHEHITWKNPYQMIEFFIRKLGHVTEYAVLTFLWIKTLAGTGLKGYPVAAASLVLSLLYACSDEWHQTFVFERTGHLIDVFGPDLGGMLLVILVFMLLHSRREWPE